jgi:hypothetical protein
VVFLDFVQFSLGDHDDFNSVALAPESKRTLIGAEFEELGLFGSNFNFNCAKTIGTRDSTVFDFFKGDKWLRRVVGSFLLTLLSVIKDSYITTLSTTLLPEHHSSLFDSEETSMSLKNSSISKSESGSFFFSMA